MTTYKVLRFFEHGDRETVETGLTLDEAQAHCKDPESSSSTATGEAATARTAARGRWFDGYEEQ